MAQTTSTVLITGGTGGLGRATALLLAEKGYRVFAGGRNAERRAQLDALARERGLPLETVEMDVCDDASVARALAAVRAKGASIDVLINNAGVGYFAVVEELRLEDFRGNFETNFFGAVRVTQQVLPEMRARRRGRIINMSSIAGKIALPLFAAYSGSKFALEAMSDALRLELHPFGIYVAVIEPGYIPTGFQGAAQELSGPYVAGVERSPYAAIYQSFYRGWRKRTGRTKHTPEDCARVVLRAVEETPPRPRYTVTSSARLTSVLKRVLPDRTMDRRLIRFFGLDRVKV